jgi:hypothetical protein
MDVSCIAISLLKIRRVRGTAETHPRSTDHVTAGIGSCLSNTSVHMVLEWMMRNPQAQGAWTTRSHCACPTILGRQACLSIFCLYRLVPRCQAMCLRSAGPISPLGGYHNAEMQSLAACKSSTRHARHHVNTHVVSHKNLGRDVKRSATPRVTRFLAFRRFASVGRGSSKRQKVEAMLCIDAGPRKYRTLAIQSYHQEWP